MIGGVVHFGLRGALAALAGIVLLVAVAHAPAQGQGTPIKFSKVDDGFALTNSTPLPPESPETRKLQEELQKAAGVSSFLKPQDPINNRMRNNYRRPAVQRLTEKEKEALDRKRNWVFALPEDEAKTPTAEKAVGVREYDENGQVKKPQTTFERFLESLSASKNPGVEVSKNPDESERAPGEDSKPEVPGEWGPSGSTLRDLTGTPTKPDLLSSGSLGNITGAPEEPLWRRYAPDLPVNPTLGRTPNQELRLKEFRELLDPRGMATATPSQPANAPSTAGFLPPPSSPGVRPPTPVSSGFQLPGLGPSLAPAPVTRPIAPTTLPDPLGGGGLPVPPASTRNSQPFMPVVPQRKF